ncbi:MAG: hypothetical protein ACE5Z5_15125 [Candidatus Bathyarchaeia archaeon]
MDEFWKKWFEANPNVWDRIYSRETEIDELRKELPIETDVDVLSSKVIERCVDISREVAKGMRKSKPELIDFGYISEKHHKLGDDIRYLAEEIRKRPIITWARR